MKGLVRRRDIAGRGSSKVANAAATQSISVDLLGVSRSPGWFCDRFRPITGRDR
jgi:hypothetical protein